MHINPQIKHREKIMEKMYIKTVCCSDGSVNNFFGVHKDRESAIKASMNESSIVSRLSNGYLITAIDVEPILNLCQNTVSDFCTNGDLGIYFNFQMGYPQDLKDDLQNLMKKYFDFDINIKLEN